MVVVALGTRIYTKDCGSIYIYSEDSFSSEIASCGVPVINPDGVTTEYSTNPNTTRTRAARVSKTRNCLFDCIVIT
jgi:hypothetical protein